MNKNSFSVKFIFSFGLFAFALMAQAQSQSNILLEACNNFKNSAKRSDCLKAAQTTATESQTQATLKPTTETPLSIDVQLAPVLQRELQVQVQAARH